MRSFLVDKLKSPTKSPERAGQPPNASPPASASPQKEVRVGTLRWLRRALRRKGVGEGRLLSIWSSKGGDVTFNHFCIGLQQLDVICTHDQYRQMFDQARETVR